MAASDNFDAILNETFEYAKDLAKNFYFNVWVNNPPECLAFDGAVVHITREGWEHLAEDSRKTKMDTLGRFFVLERAEVLLETTSHFQDYRKSPNGRVQYWGFSGVVDLVEVRVIVRSIESGRKHFYSVIRRGSVEEEK